MTKSPADALEIQLERCGPWPISLMEQLSTLMTTSPSLTPHGDVQEFPFSLPTIPSLLTHSPGSSGDMADDTLHYNDVNSGPSAADLTACVSSFYFSPSSSASNTKKSPPSSLIARATKATLGQSELPLKMTIIQPSCLDLSTRVSEGEISDSKPHLAPPSSEKANILYQSVPMQRSVQDVSPKMSTPLRSIPSYDLIGTIGQGIDRKGLKCNQKDGFYVLKTVRQEDSSSLMNLKMVEELALLQLVTRASRSGQLGAHFLQVLVDDFQDGNFPYMTLVRFIQRLGYLCLNPVYTMQGIPSDYPLGARNCCTFSHLRSALPVSVPSTLTDHLLASVSLNRVVHHLRLLIAEISLGLLYLHENGIVHQDVKPANIMISRTGHVVIGDFGAASRLPLRSLTLFHASLASTFGRSCAPNEYGPIVLQPDDFITFTPLYAAPELRYRNLMGLVVYDERADWWSLGILVRELITGSALFNPPHGISTLRNGPRSDGGQSLSFGPLESLTALNSNEWFPSLESLLRSLLAHDPDERLSGLHVKGHSFFGPILELWAEVAALKYPPCPNPSTFCVDQSVSFDLDPQQIPLYHRVSGSHAVDERPSFGDQRDVSMELYAHYVRLPADDSGGQSSRRESTEQEPNALPTNGYEESDQGSELQALPSTASIYFNSLEVDNTLVREIYDSEVDVVAVNDPTNILPEPIRDFNNDGHFISRYLLKSQLDSPFSLRKAQIPSKNPFPAEWGDWAEHCTDRPLTLVPGFSIAPPRLVLPENITLSLLEAMDNRDRRGTMSCQCPNMKPRNVPAKKDRSRRLLRTVVQRILRRLRFW